MGKSVMYKSITSIIRDWLIDNEYDGLANDNCGCGWHELFECGERNLDCVPAFKVKCNASECSYCSFLCEGYKGYTGKVSYRYEANKN